jgi:hypothetical protein
MKSKRQRKGGLQITTTSSLRNLTTRHKSSVKKKMVPPLKSRHYCGVSSFENPPASFCTLSPEGVHDRIQDWIDVGPEKTECIYYCRFCEE